MPGTVITLVTTEERDAIGRIVVHPVAAFLDPDQAEEFASRFNENPRTEPKTAETTEVPIIESGRAPGPPPDKTRRALTAEAVIEIRQRFAMGETQRALAPVYGVTNQTISDVVRRRTYQWVS